MRVRLCYVFFFKEKTAYEMRISDWSSDVCSSDLLLVLHPMRSRTFLAEAALLVGLVLVVVAGEELGVRVAFERNDVGGDAVEEPAVMRDHDRRTGEFQQRVFQRAQGFHVQVVGRFVEQQIGRALV